MPYLDISHTSVSSRHFREPYMSFWTKIVPALVRDTRDAADDTSATNVCPEEIGSMFHVNMLTAENIILALTIVSAALLLAFFLVCGYAIASHGRQREYNVKPVQYNL